MDSSLTPFPYRISSLSNITPLTYRDGETFAEELETIKNFLANTLVPDTDRIILNLIEEFQKGVLNAENHTTAAKEEWIAKFNEFISNFTLEIVAIETSAVAEMVNTPDNPVRTRITGLIDSAIVTATALQEEYTDIAVQAATEGIEQRAAVSQSGALNALEAELRGDLETKSAVDLIRGIYPSGPIDIVTIGDSYFTGYQPPPTPWVTPIPQVLTDILNGQGLNQYRLHNYADNAGGYDTTIGGGDTYFDTQVTAAINDATITNCRLIIVGGGRNDSGKDVYAKAKAIYNRLKAKWPKARLVVFPMWTREKFTSGQRTTFSSIFRAAKDVGAVYDTNSLWVNAFTDASLWIDSVLHPKAELVTQYAYALHSLVQGGSLPAQSAQLNVHASSGVTLGVITLDGFSVSLSFQQYVGAAFDASYVLATVPYPCMFPGNVNQYLIGYSGNGNNMTMYTVSAENGDIFVTNIAGVAGISGMTGSYPLGM